MNISYSSDEIVSEDLGAEARARVADMSQDPQLNPGHFYVARETAHLNSTLCLIGELLAELRQEGS